MWYFSWVLGLGLACTFAVLNAMWFELVEPGDEEDDRPPR
ncbi:MAG TPA: cytochrome bd-I oxidase subunit CydX [Stellaceae bacterium]|nr:cytochrome bd-I oxidase subunit CydX [Stellaceae bacterium]